MSMIERVARAIWNIRREEEDRCDMELEDMGEDHSVWSEARAVIEAIRQSANELGKFCWEKSDSDHWWIDEFVEIAFEQFIDTALKEEA